jgi:hypothetical protein
MILLMILGIYLLFWEYLLFKVNSQIGKAIFAPTSDLGPIV